MGGFVMEAKAVQSMVASRADGSVEGVLSELVGRAKRLARAPISHFYVGAVGLGVSGRIFLGVNLEFEGLPLNNSVHAEQFLVANAAQHGEQGLHVIAVSAAPCGHCRQFLQELRGAPDLRILIVDAAAEACTLAHFLPHRFAPNDVLAGDFPLLLEPHHNGLSLKITNTTENFSPASLHLSCSSGTFGEPSIDHSSSGTAESDVAHLEGHTATEEFASHVCTDENGKLPCDFAARLEAAAIEAANKSHAPYTNSPSGVAILTRSGKMFSGSYAESVAHNPSLPPLQAALVAFIAQDGGSYEDIIQAVLVEREGAPVQFMDTARLLLKKISPHCIFTAYYAS